MASYNANMFNIPRPRDAPSAALQPERVVRLPLNLIALIISHVSISPILLIGRYLRLICSFKLDNVADLARCCQTSRVMNYMTLPRLFENITLCSYDTIRYRDDQPEGLGSSSPFAMGLNALVTRNVAGLVRSLTLQGQWKEHDLQEFSSVGRVPDDAMMLNIAVRAAVDRCTGLENFKLVLQKAAASWWIAHMLQMGSKYKTTVKRLLRSCKSAQTTGPSHSLPIESFSSAACSSPRNASSTMSNSNRYGSSVLSGRHRLVSVWLAKAR